MPGATRNVNFRRGTACHHGTAAGRVYAGIQPNAVKEGSLFCDSFTAEEIKRRNHSCKEEFSWPLYASKISQKTSRPREIVSNLRQEDHETKDHTMINAVASETSKWSSTDSNEGGEKQNVAHVAAKRKFPNKNIGVDLNLSLMSKNLKQGGSTETWSTTHWDGEEVDSRLSLSLSLSSASRAAESYHSQDLNRPSKLSRLNGSNTTTTTSTKINVAWASTLDLTI